MHPLRRIRQISRADWRLAAETAGVVAAVRVGLWILPFRTVRRLVMSSAIRPRTVRGRTCTAERIAWAVRGVSRYIPGASCLTQALAAELLLIRSGHPARLHIGVARGGGGEFAAHAWIECYGRVLVGGAGRWRYKPLLVMDGEKV